MDGRTAPEKLMGKISSIELINFMVYEHVRLSFDERGIINLKGYNSAGKSTILKALAVCFLDSFKRKQQKFIRYGADYLRVCVDFDDGVRIVRDKYINGQSLYEMYKNNELLYSTKEGNKLTRVDDVPEVISTYLGLIVMENGCLNYQSRRDPLWLIETGGSENYYSLNEVLKTESIARANALLNSDKNKLNSEIAQIEGELQATELALNSCSMVTEELITSLSERELYVQGILEKYSKANEMNNLVGTLSDIKPIPEVTGIDTSRLSAILEIEKLLLELEKEKVVPKMEKIETEKFQLSSKMVAEIGEYDKIFKKVVGADIEPVSTDRMPELNKILKGIKDLDDSLQSRKAVVQDYKNVSAQLNLSVQEAKSRGVKYVKCTNCGAYMEVAGGESVAGS